MNFPIKSVRTAGEFQPTRQEHASLVSPHKRGARQAAVGVATNRPYVAYTDDFGSGNTGSWVRMLVGQTTEICSPAFCITTGVERSFWPASGVPGRKNLTP